MLLFPGEEEFLAGQRFLKITEQPFGDGTAKMAVCRGRCRREWRPLSCRIYPLAPRTDAAGNLRVEPDPRAKYHCPLLSPGAETYWDARFTEAVRQAFGALSEIPEMAGFLREYTQMLERYDKFVGTDDFFHGNP